MSYIHLTRHVDIRIPSFEVHMGILAATLSAMIPLRAIFDALTGHFNGEVAWPLGCFFASLIVNVYTGLKTGKNATVAKEQASTSVRAVEEVKSLVSLVKDGKDGLDGLDGQDGKDGRDGKDAGTGPFKLPN